jgi:hypothetical protein
VENTINKDLAAERNRLRQEKYRQAQEEEQERIARQQEEAGLGEGIYSGQGNIFSGSTDNLSISSTVSSASVIMRKMGAGVKRSTRSLVGLFRPKSIHGVPPADSSSPEPSLSMVNVEAERERVNVNLDPHDQAGGGTGFPKLGRNSLDSGAVQDGYGIGRESLSSDNSRSRKSIVGGERERAEVLSTIKKGILKRSGPDSASSSPRVRPVDVGPLDFKLPNIPHVSSTPNSQPSTPDGDNDSDFFGDESDYFSQPAIRVSGDSGSVPGTPQSISRINVSFSPKIQFHDTWPSGEYDRRGEIATCNRLTPMLAQQIKEELNTFKMEMEVHEESKIYTHFF